MSKCPKCNRYGFKAYFDAGFRFCSNCGYKDFFYISIFDNIEQIRNIYRYTNSATDIFYEKND
jgi:hypothetical protein